VSGGQRRRELEGKTSLEIAPLRTDGIQCKFSASRKAKQKSRLMVMCGNFHRSTITITSL